MSIIHLEQQKCTSYRLVSQSSAYSKPGPPKRPPYPSKYSLLLRLPSYFLWSATKNSDYIQVNNVIFFKVVDTK